MKSQEVNSKRRRFQFRLASLFVLTTCLSFIFAYPRFAFAWLALVAAVVGGLLVFVVFVHLPVCWLMDQLSRRGNVRPKGKDEAVHRNGY